MSRLSAVNEPQWHDLSALRGQRLPASIADWIRDQGSLTRALVAACEGQFRVAVARQGWSAALTSERHLLDMPERHTALLREVKLLCNDKPWVFARTLIPASSLRGRARALAHLRTRPLGAVLFADPATRRLAVQAARLTPRHALYAPACSHLRKKPNELWGRRTLFEYAGQTLLVNEIFLPPVHDA